MTRENYWAEDIEFTKELCAVQKRVSEVDYRHLAVHYSATNVEAEHTVDAIKGLHLAPKGELVDWDFKIFKKTGSQMKEYGGYHLVILRDGSIRTMRPFWRQGAHIKGHNWMVGVCLCGKDTFTNKQIKALKKLIKMLGCDKVYTHNYLQPDKGACPNLPREVLLSIDKIHVGKMGKAEIVGGFWYKLVKLIKSLLDAI